MKFFLFTFSFFLLTLNGCIPLESEHNLGDGYYLFGDGANTSIVKQVEGKTGIYDGAILGEIVDYSFNNKFIVVYRNASQQAKVYNNLQDSLWEVQAGKDSLQFWIINKLDGAVYGPMQKEEYLHKREYLKIPKAVKLKEE